MILQSINLSRSVGDMELGWIIASCIVLVVFWTTAFSLLSRSVQKDRDIHMWPTLKQVDQATDRQIVWWVNNLPIASNDAEMIIIDRIVRRYLDVDVLPDGRPVSANYQTAPT